MMEMKNMDEEVIKRFEKIEKSIDILTAKVAELTINRDVAPEKKAKGKDKQVKIEST